MTRIDFYLTQAGNIKQRMLTACKLAEKATRLGHKVFIHTDQAEQATALDELLWTFRPGSFLPHTTADADDAQSHPIIIGCAQEPGPVHDILINLAASTPDFFTRFERVAEIVGGTEDDKQAARERFRFYRDRGYALETHDLGT